MFIVLRKSSVKRTLALAVLLIMVGLSIAKPQAAKAESNIVYLYPTAANNPVEQNGLFWWESHPDWGSLTLPEWAEIIRNQEIIVGVPEHYLMGSTMAGDKLGRFIVNKIRGKTGGKADKDVFVYNRKIFRDGIQEEIRVEVGKHFRDNDNFRKFVDTIKDGLTDPDEIQKIPPKGSTDDTAQAAMLFGNTMILGGLVLLLKVLAVAAL